MSLQDVWFDKKIILTLEVSLKPHLTPLLGKAFIDSSRSVLNYIEVAASSSRVTEPFSETL